ncbi:GATA transcription factor 5 [Acorus calamus]|uniref:GATA transcription factor n=1 Tax=Acorus calamus TaxID=4465 RepID=A0AAV9DR67_ACOCL|nr:GATA transcription factor 5 [Acorus calamus]
MESALKTSLAREREEVPLQSFLLPEESSFVVVGAAGEDFSVDELLDFGGFVEEEEEEEEEEEPELKRRKVEEEREEEVKDCSSISETNSSSITTDLKEDFEPLSVPTDDIADLEWLSQFVDDSFMEFPSPYPPCPRPKPETHKTQKSPAQARPTAGPVAAVFGPVPARARSKRSRSGGLVWSIRNSSFPETSSATSSSSTTTTSSTSSSSSFPCLIFTNRAHPFSEPPKKKKQQRKPRLPTAWAAAEDGSGGVVGGRRCSHCQVQKTPQWRTGPNGLKTLCNACGVRFKSGRLLPEYRPAGSPTFLADVHSNSHRKVLEMRRLKDTTTTAAAGGGPLPVHSF